MIYSAENWLPYKLNQCVNLGGVMCFSFKILIIIISILLINVNSNVNNNTQLGKVSGISLILKIVGELIINGL